jgi:hypothetical protein
MAADSRSRRHRLRKPARIMAQRKYASDNAIDAIVATAQQILIESAQPVHHEGRLQAPYPRLQTDSAGAFFTERPDRG